MQRLVDIQIEIPEKAKLAQEFTLLGADILRLNNKIEQLDGKKTRQEFLDEDARIREIERDAAEYIVDLPDRTYNDLTRWWSSPEGYSIKIKGFNALNALEKDKQEAEKAFIFGNRYMGMED